MNRKYHRLVVLISGTGSTLQAILDAVHEQSLPAEVVAVFSHEPWSYGLLRAAREGVPAILHDLAEYRFEGKSDRTYEADLADQIAAYEPDLVVVADWQHPLHEAFFARFPNRVVTLYSGLPGEAWLFDPYGQNPVSRAFESYHAGQTSGLQITSQLLHDETPAGPVVAQRQVPIYDFDTLIDLEERLGHAQQALILRTLHLLLPEPPAEEQAGLKAVSLSRHLIHQG